MPTKKYGIVLLVVAVVIGLLYGNLKTDDSLTENVPLYLNPSEQLTDESLNYLENTLDQYGLTIGSVIDEEFFLGNGVNVPNIDLTTSTGETINLYKLDKPVMIEIFADWCSYCQQEEVEYLDKIINSNPDVVYVQYLETGSDAELKSFYENAGVEPRNNTIIVYQNEEFSEWLANNGFGSFPTFYFINKEHRVSGSHVGLLEDEIANASMSIAFNEEYDTYMLQTNYGFNIARLTRRIRIAREYVDNLEEIEIPRSYLNGQKGD